MTPPATRGIVQRTASLLVVAALLAPAAGFGQRRAPSKGPRAIGVLVWAVDPDALPSSRAATKPKPWIIPVALWMDQRYFDASLYGARPVPMALEPEIIYEAQKAGDPQGLFTVGSASRMNRMWTADGGFRTMAEIEAVRNRPKPTFAMPGDMDTPPRLRRGGDSASAAPPPKTEKPASVPSDHTPADHTNAAPPPRGADDPPRLAKPAAPQSAPPSSPGVQTSGTQTAAAPAATQTSSDEKTTPEPSGPPKPLEDPDAPRLERRTGSAPRPSTPAASAPGPTSSKPATTAKQPSQPAPKPATASTQSAVASGSATPGTARNEMMVAVSDAANTESHPFGFQWNPEEQQRVRAAILKLAQDEISKYAQRQLGLSITVPLGKTTQPGRGAPGQPKASARNEPLEVAQFNAFDLDLSNYPVVVLAAKQVWHTVKTSSASTTLAEMRDRTFFITMVVRTDMNPGAADEFHKLLVSLTDDLHIEQFPRLELVDVVDADGDGVAELLFRSTDRLGSPPSPWDWSFQLYRDGPDQLRKVFDSTGKE